MRYILPVAVALWAGSLSAQSSPTNLAQDGLAKTITKLSDDPAAHGFEIGMLQALHAVEKTLQARYEFGLGDSITGLPILRLDGGDMRNPQPKPSTPGTLSDIVAGFAEDIEGSRASLEQAETAGVQPFELELQDIWFDINGNETREEAESAFAVLGPVVLGGRAYRELTESEMATTPLRIRFDTADHAWLLAYTHMLSGFGNLYLAFDPEPVLQELADQRAALADAPEIANHYDLDVVNADIARLEQEIVDINLKQEAITEEIKPFSEQRDEVYSRLHDATDDAMKAEIQAELDLLRETLDPLEETRRGLWQDERLIENELNAAKSKLPADPNMLQMMGVEYQPSIDLVYVILTALRQDPDPAHIRAAHENWRAMITHNRDFWVLLDQETDNELEWIPNASQTSALPLTLPPRLALGWQNILADVEAVLEGKLLIHHPLLPAGYGISIPAYVDDPSSLDIINWFHGIGAYRYAAKGPRLTAQSWQAFQRLAAGNAGGFALFFN